MQGREDLFELADHTWVRLAHVGPADRQRLLNGFRQLSTASNIRRFHSFRKDFSARELDYLLQVDQVHHLAIGALDENWRQDTGIGLARCIGSKDEPDTAEVAITIIDKYQGRGLGRLLYTVLQNQARQSGYRYLRNIVGKDNRPMLHLLKDLGAIPVTETGNSIELVLILEGLSDFTLIH